MRVLWRVVLATMVLLAGAATALGAQPQQTGAVTLIVEAGFNGYTKVDNWLPIHVVLSSPQQLDGEVVVVTEEARIRYAASASLSPGARREFMVYAPPTNSTVKVDFVSNNRVLASAQPALRTLSRQDRIVLVLGDPPDGFNFLSDLPTPFDGRSYLAPTTIEYFPDRAAALNSVDAVVLSNVDTSSLNHDQQSALRAWLVGGGHLILNGGPGAALTLNGLSDFAPARVSSALIATPVDGLLDFMRPDALSPLQGAGEGVQVQAIALSPTAPDVQTLVASRDTPLIMRRELGRGLVDQLAFDPTLAPLRDWIGKSALFASILGGRVDLPNVLGTIRDDYPALVAARALPAASLPSFLVVAGFLILYVLCLGPLNFLLLRRIRRPELAWLSIPVLVAGFTVLGLVTGFRLRGNEPQVHRLSVVLGDARLDEGSRTSESIGGQPDATLATAPSQSVVGLFAPRRTTLDMALGRGLAREVAQTAEPTATPIEQPGDVVTLAYGDPDRLVGVTVSNTDVRAFYSRGEGSLPDIEADLRFVPGRSTAEPARITGEINNASLVALSGCVIVAGRDYASIGDIGPNQHVEAEVLLHMNRSQPAMNVGQSQVTGSFYPSYSSSTRRTSPPSSRAPSTYRDPFDLSGAKALEVLFGWRNYGADEMRAAAEGNFINAIFGEPSARVGQGVNLACWDTVDRTGAVVDGASYTDRGLRVWRLPVQSYLADGDSSGGPSRIVLPSDIFAWGVRATSSSTRLGDAGLNLSPGQHVLGFSPWFGVRTTGDLTVTLGFEFSSSTRLSDMRDTTFWLYDWQAREYTQVISRTGMSGGQDSVFGAYASPAGEVRVRVDNAGGLVTLSNVQVSLRAR